MTALQVVAVHALAEGEEPTVGAALRRAAPRLPAAAGAVVLYSLGVALGLVALIVPGIWLSVRWYFAAQAAVVDGLSRRCCSSIRAPALASSRAGFTTAAPADPRVVGSPEKEWL